MRDPASRRAVRRRGGSVIVACTIIAGNYLPAARVLTESFFAAHPDGSFTVLIVDDEARDLTPDGPVDRRVAWWRLADLGLDPREIHTLAAIYDVTELSTSVKPLLLQRLLDARGCPVIYLDPDIQIFASLAPVSALAARHGLVLTPHVTRPIPDDGRGADALFVLAAGVYNLGFAAVSASATPCLAWWWQQTRRRALNDIRHQMFTDQRWADYMPALFEHHLLKDPGYNVAYWNLHERPVTRTPDGWLARDVPLRFFHFSGFDPGTPWLLSRHQGPRPRILLSEHPVLARLCDGYADALARADDGTGNRRAYGWSETAEGLELTQRIRRLYWSAIMDAERDGGPHPPDPFDAAAPGAFTAWLNAPDARGARRWSRYVRAIYDARPDVQAYAPDIDGHGADRFASWLLTSGVVEERIPPALAPPPPRPAPAPPEHAVPTLPPGLNVAGYFHAELGVGEAARLLTRAIAASGISYTTTVEQAPLSRQEPHPFDNRRPNDCPFDVNLLCVNADVTPAFARSAGPDFFAGRHTIGYWFWEVDPLPAAMHGAFEHVDEVWTATEYVAGILRSASAGRRPVFTVPIPLVAPQVSGEMTREQLGLPSDRFVFLFVFDFLSELERKNPLGAIEAFSNAFAPGEGPVLVLKSINGHARVPDMERLRRAAARRPDVLIRDGYLDAGTKNALIAACDCYVSLHRAEGLGLTLAEAMAFGRPAIATGYSGNRHFMTDENSFLVDYRLTGVAAHGGPYPSDARWAEPDLAHAARLMRAVYDDREEAARRAARGRADLLRHHGVAASADAVSNRLAEIRRARTHLPDDAAATSAAVPMSEAPSGPTAEPAEGVGTAENPSVTPGGGAVAAEAIAMPTQTDVSPAPRALHTAAVDAFAAALPHLRELATPRLSVDDRPFQWLRRFGQRALFRAIRPYTFQQGQFQDALLSAVRETLEQSARTPTERCPPQAESGDPD